MKIERLSIVYRGFLIVKKFIANDMTEGTKFEHLFID